MQVLLAALVIALDPEFGVARGVAGGVLHVVLTGRGIVNDRDDSAPPVGVGGIADMGELLLDGRLGVLAGEELQVIGLAEGPEIHRLRSFQVGDPDQLAGFHLEPLAGACRHVVGLANGRHAWHGPPPPKGCRPDTSSEPPL